MPLKKIQVDERAHDDWGYDSLVWRVDGLMWSSEKTRSCADQYIIKKENWYQISNSLILKNYSMLKINWNL